MLAEQVVLLSCRAGVESSLCGCSQLRLTADQAESGSVHG